MTFCYPRAVSVVDNREMIAVICLENKNHAQVVPPKNSATESSGKLNIIDARRPGTENIALISFVALEASDAWRHVCDGLRGGIFSSC